MKSRFLIFLLTLILTLNGANMASILPTPKIVIEKKGEFLLEGNIVIVFNKNDARINYAINLLKESIAVKTKSGVLINEKASKQNIKLELIQSEEMINKNIPKDKLDEAYILNIENNSISISAEKEAGLFYGCMSLLQLIDNCENNKLISMEIIDYPDMRMRGISDDISRGQVSKLENFKKIISFLARYKMNTYLPYIEDMIEFSKYPSIGKGRGALTKSEIKELVEFAELNFIEVIPVFQTLGHYENLLSLPEFIHYAEYPGAASLCVTDEKIYPFLEDLLKEVFELFPSKFFHMGADESYDVGLGRSKSALKNSSIAELHANHYKRIYDICKSNGKEVLMYGDIILDLPEILNMLPKDITIVDWHYRADYHYSSTDKFKNHGFKYVVSPSVWNFVTTFPTLVNSTPNIYNIIKSGLRNNSVGMVNSNWGDYGAETIKELIYYGYAYSAQCSWNFEAANINDFSKLYFCDFFGVKNNEGYEVYKILSNPLNQMMWHEVWRHPLLPLRTPSWWENNVGIAAKINHLEQYIDDLSEKIKSLKTKATRNRDHLEILDFYVNLNEWYALKLKSQGMLQMFKQLSDNEIELLKGMIKNSEAKLEAIKNNYSALWKKYYKEENLSMIQDKFSRLSSYFNETYLMINDFKAVDKSPLLETEWIYAPVSKDSFATKAEFYTKLELAEIPSKCLVQLIGDSYVKLYINDKFVDEVFARRSLSLYTEYKRIKLIDITKYLKTGENRIRVEAENFSSKGSAGFNLTTYINGNNIRFDTYSKERENNTIWYSKPYGSDEWTKPSFKKYPYEIIAPNFLTNRPSWIER